MDLLELEFEGVGAVAGGVVVLALALNRNDCLL